MEDCSVCSYHTPGILRAECFGCDTFKHVKELNQIMDHTNTLSCGIVGVDAYGERVTVKWEDGIESTIIITHHLGSGRTTQSDQNARAAVLMEIAKTYFTNKGD